MQHAKSKPAALHRHAACKEHQQLQTPDMVYLRSFVCFVIGLTHLRLCVYTMAFFNSK